MFSLQTKGSLPLHRPLMDRIGAGNDNDDNDDDDCKSKVDVPE